MKMMKMIKIKSQKRNQFYQNSTKKNSLINGLRITLKLIFLKRFKRNKTMTGKLGKRKKNS